MRFIIAKNAEQAFDFAIAKGWKTVTRSKYIDGDVEVRYCTRDCEFRNSKDAVVYAVGEYQLSPAWGAVQHWLKVGRINVFIENPNE